MYDRMQPAVEKNAHEFYQQQLHGFVDRAKDELQQQHEAQMKMLRSHATKVGRAWSAMAPRCVAGLGAPGSKPPPKHPLPRLVGDCLCPSESRKGLFR